MGNFDVTCLPCHTVSSWKPSTFNHNTTAYALTGAHINVRCAQCHATAYKGTAKECYGCHQADFRSVIDPNHISNNFDQNCAICHTNTTWKPATFNHSTSAFPLTGAHLAVACIDCHRSGYDNTSKDCYACHQDVFSAATDPDHKLANFSHVCTGCHSTTVWRPSTYNHNVTGYALTGAHTSVRCVSCHATKYDGTSSSCSACHTADYNTATNPNHKTLGFPTSCQTCHRLTTWQDVTWNHDGPYFPIYSGKHNGRWSTCSVCHTNSGNFAVFSCFNCHEHNQTKMNDKHQNMKNYSYVSSACYNCHPRGSD
jgi:nitrate/TMAO reductase-like tetraheme cytochrome c subunit